MFRTWLCHLRAGFQQCKSFVEMCTVRCCPPLSHGDGAPGDGSEDCITRARRLWRAELGKPPPTSSNSTSCLSFPALPRRLWRVVCWVDILLDVIGGVESFFSFLQEQIKGIIIIINVAGGMSEDHDRCFSMLVLGAFMMMSFICSYRNKKEEPSSIYTLRKVRAIRGCLEGLTLMI